MSVIKTIMVTAIFCFATFANAEINVNTATIEQLTELQNIGAVKALAIVEYRDKHGAFKSIDDLLRVDGIGMAILEANKGMLSVGRQLPTNASIEKPMPASKHLSSGVSSPSVAEDN